MNHQKHIINYEINYFVHKYKIEISFNVYLEKLKSIVSNNRLIETYPSVYPCFIKGFVSWNNI